MSDARTIMCPHCAAPLVRLELPEAAGWDASYHLACFNDDCPYFVRGWAWMSEQYGVNSSYRYRIDPQSGRASPIAVWSRTAMRDRIVAEPHANKESP
jgi:hypothetical protein